MDDHRLTIISNISVLREEIADLRAQNKSIAFVPTMGALHDGHLSLIEFAKKHADKTICSIYVNPTQFGADEDLDAYPRPLEADIRALESKQTDFVFTPTSDGVYPPNYSTTINVSGISDGLCGESRPDHFNGVATIVTKLLMMVQPDVAIFGEKDYQQLMVIKRLVTDLNIPIKILGAPIIRADDGLALSSRNQYLSPKERGIAPKLFETISQLAIDLKIHKQCDDEIKKAKSMLNEAGFEVDYLEVRSTTDLALVQQIDKAVPARLFVAAKLGTTRLIDNVAI